MLTGGFYAIFFGMLATFLGPGSMFFHASMTELLSAIDPVSIALFMLFIFVYDVWRIFKWDRGQYGWIGFLVVWALLAIGASILIFSGITDPVSMGVIGVAAALELVILFLNIRDRGTNGLKRQWWWAGLIILAFGAAVVFWVLSQTGGPLCTDPFTLWQGHALWHLLAMGVVPVLFFLSFRSETYVS
jgi:hypothetical protein